MFSLREYREPSSRLPDRLPWACLVAPGVVLQKDAIFQRTLAFRGPDLASSLDSELVAASARLNNALRRLGSGWALFVEAQRFLSSAYPAASWPSPGGGRRRSRAPARLRAGRRALRVELLPDLHVEAAARPRRARARPSSTRTPAAASAPGDERSALDARALRTSRRRVGGDRRHPAGGLPRGRPARRRSDALVPAQHHLDAPPSGARARDADVPRRALAGHALHAGRRADARRPLPLHLHGRRASRRRRCPGCSTRSTT